MYIEVVPLIVLQLYSLQLLHEAPSKCSLYPGPHPRHLPLWMKRTHFRCHGVPMCPLYPFFMGRSLSPCSVVSHSLHCLTQCYTKLQIDTLQMQSWKCKSHWAEIPSSAGEEQKCSINNSYVPQTSWKEMHLKYRIEEFIWHWPMFFVLMSGNVVLELFLTTIKSLYCLLKEEIQERKQQENHHRMCECTWASVFRTSGVEERGCRSPSIMPPFLREGGKHPEREGAMCLQRELTETQVEPVYCRVNKS